MKKIICIIAALLAAAAIAAGAWSAGRAAGIRHAIEDSEIWTVDVYNPDDPESSAWGEYDQIIYIDLDGDTYEHGMYQC